MMIIKYILLFIALIFLVKKIVGLFLCKISIDYERKQLEHLHYNYWRNKHHHHNSLLLDLEYQEKRQFLEVIDVVYAIYNARLHHNTRNSIKAKAKKKSKIVKEYRKTIRKLYRTSYKDALNNCKNNLINSRD